MLLTTAVCIFFAFWSALYLLDYYFRSRNVQSYLQFSERHGLIITPFQIRWYTHRFQSWLQLVSCLQCTTIRRLLAAWFTLGTFTTLVCYVGMLIFLSRALILHLDLSQVAYSAYSLLLGYFKAAWSPANRSDGVPATDTSTLVTSTATLYDVGLVPVIPGWNVPWEHIPLFLLSLVLAAVVHELGHALAAINENVGVNGFGVFLIAVYPGAFTEIETGTLARSDWFRQLRIYCGGIWHNLTLALCGVLFLYSLPVLLSPAYLVNKGVVVTEVTQGVGLDGLAGLQEGHVVYGINNCKVFNEDSWTQCLDELRKSHSGYCVPTKDVTANKAERVVNLFGELHCCDESNSTSHLCFYYKNETVIKADFEYSCMPARYVTDHYVCNTSLPCRTGRSTCLYPALFNSTKLFRFFIANSTKPVLYVGQVREVLEFVTISSFVPRGPRIPAIVPVILELFCKYLITFSLALGLLNAVPCFGLDGQFITAALVDALCGHKSITPDKITNRKTDIVNMYKRRLVYKFVLFYGTSVLAVNICVGFFNFFKMHSFS